jgi:hypothetical protein
MSRLLYGGRGRQPERRYRAEGTAHAVVCRVYTSPARWLDVFRLLTAGTDAARLYRVVEQGHTEDEPRTFRVAQYPGGEVACDCGNPAGGGFCRHESALLRAGLLDDPDGEPDGGADFAEELIDAASFDLDDTWACVPLSAGDRSRAVELGLFVGEGR